MTFFVPHKKKKMKSTPTTTARLKYLALFILVLQNASLVLVMRASQLQNTSYLASTAVVMGEVLKFFISFGFILFETSSFNETIRILTQYLLRSPRDLFNLSIPAFLYVIQNNLVYLATANLDPAPFQLLFQLKIFTTALLSMSFLNKKLFFDHWQALLILFIGVVIVQLSTMQEQRSTAAIRLDQNPLIGLIAILVAVTCSGLSGVWFEKILKTSSVSIWVRNVQLASISLIISLFSVMFKDYEKIQSEGFLTGYTYLVWLVILLQAGGGIVVALVVKYADNIQKGFATSISTVLSTLGSVYWFGFQISYLFSVGALLVLWAAYLYNMADLNSKLLEANKNEENNKNITVDIEKDPLTRKE